MTAQGTEARRGETARLDAKRDGPVGNADAPTNSKQEEPMSNAVTNETWEGPAYEYGVTWGPETIPTSPTSEQQAVPVAQSDVDLANKIGAAFGYNAGPEETWLEEMLARHRGDATQTREAECFLCAGKCRGHGLGDSAAWEPEAGSVAAEIRKALPIEPTEAMVLAAWDAAVPFGALPTTKCVPAVWQAMLAALNARGGA